MRKVILVLLVASMSTGCATHVVSSNERSVIVEANRGEIAEAQKLADIECAKYNRFAKISIKPDNYNHDYNYIFECVQ